MASKYCDRADVCKMRGWCATDFNQENGCEFFEPETNADRIRDMSDEEMAKRLAWRAECPDKNHRDKCTEQCETCWLDWLKSPAEDNNG